ncbi:MAG: ATP-dependent 6-phosphofructokinase [Verrucomicrobiota bacterium]|nr:ATP-dependent 6-phosphofructokinase [Verrucomicrobiota bacterium]
MQPYTALLENKKIDFSIKTVGKPTLNSPLKDCVFIKDSQKICWPTKTEDINAFLKERKTIPVPAFQQAGPREKIFYDPSWTRAAIVTCGGLCPGLNDVIKGIVNTLSQEYGVKNIFGIRYGYRGLIPSYGYEPLNLTPEMVDGIHENAGTILGASRGQQDTLKMIESLRRLNISMLFCIGGDGTLRCAGEIADEIKKQKLPISIIGIPKTIDNDLNFIDRTFGFETAIYAAAPVISCAHDEAKGAHNGIGLVKLMGRDSGFIAAQTSLANSYVNFCLIPETNFEMDGENGLLKALEKRLKAKAKNQPHAVVVVAEGAGQNLIKDDSPIQNDASGNIKKKDIGVFIKDKINKYFSEKSIDVSVKYFDPSYMIRSVPARGTDAVFCYMLAHNAVHAAMAGKTNMVVGHWNSYFTHVPIKLATMKRRKVNIKSPLWQAVLASTRQSEYWQE